jgi:carbon storage regulator
VLVLSRKVGEALVFPALNIAVSVLQIRGDKVRLGVMADDGVRVYRDELLARLELGKETDAVPDAE